MKNTITALATSLLLFCLLNAPQKSSGQYVFTTIDDPTALAQSGTTYAMGIYSNIVVGYYYGNTLHGFYHILGTTNYVTLDDPVGYTNGSSSTQALGVSGNLIVGTYQDNKNYTGTYGFVYNILTSNYTTIADSVGINQGENSTQGTGIDGSNIVGVVDQTVFPNGYLEGYLGTPSGGNYVFKQYYYPSPSAVMNEGSYSTTNYRSYATGISSSNVTGYYVDLNLNSHGFLYNIITSGFSIIPAPNGFNAPLTGINGNTAVGYFADASHSYNYSGFTYNIVTSNYTSFHDPLAPGNCFAQGIYGSTVVGYYLDNNGVTHGYVATIPVPVLNVVQSGNNLVFTATNGVPSTPCFIIDSPNITLPLSQWSNLSSNFFNTNGIFKYTNALSTSATPLFYALKAIP